MEIPAHLLSTHDEVCKDLDCPEMVKQSTETGRWYITMQHAGYNSDENNADGYARQRDAIDASLSFRTYVSPLERAMRYLGAERVDDTHYAYREFRTPDVVRPQEGEPYVVIQANWLGILARLAPHGKSLRASFKSWRKGVVPVAMPKWWTPEHREMVLHPDGSTCTGENREHGSFFCVGKRIRVDLGTGREWS